MSAVLDTIREIAERIAVTYGVEIFEIELKGGGKARTLRIFLDKPEGVMHDDCVAFSREISRILDVEEVVPGGSYLLEVSSPGLDRKMRGPKDYERFLNSLMKVQLFEAVEGIKVYTGRLTAFDGAKLTLDLTDATSRQQKRQGLASIELSLSNVEKARLVPEF
jgi:ribosome maturation factor RimP